MPYLIDADGPEAGTVAIGRSLSDMVGDIPGLVGAFTVANMTEGKLTSWPASMGGGVLSQATPARAPDVVTQEGARVAMAQGAYSLGGAHVWAMAAF